MRLSHRTLLASAVVALGAIGLTPTAAFASTPEPQCGSGGSRIVCHAPRTDGGTGPTSWYIGGYPAGTGNLNIPCVPGQYYSINYSYHNGATTVFSAAVGIVCRYHPWD